MLNAPEPTMHSHHFAPCGDFDFIPPHAEKHATIVFQRWTDLHLNYILGASGAITPPSSFYIALATQAVSAFSRNTADTVPTEISGGGYGRQAIARTIAQAGIDWAASTFDNTLSTGGTSMAGDQVTFSFSGTPTTNGANDWYMTGVSSGTGNFMYVAADTAATRNFANGDTEKVTPTIKSG